MGSPAPNHFMILSALIIVLIFRSSMVTATSPLMQDACNSTEIMSLKTITYDECINALNLDPRSTGANLKDLARIALNLGLSNATDSEKFIQDLISNHTDPSLIKPLNSCLDWYYSVKDSFKTALEDIEADPDSANYDAEIAGEYADECVEELSKRNITSVTARNKYIKLYSLVGEILSDTLNNLV